MKRCSVEACKTNGDPNLRSTVTFFSFPKWEDAERFDKWVEALHTKPENFQHKRRFVCSRHFREEDIDQTTLTKKKLFPGFKVSLILSKNAIPSLCLSSGGANPLSLPNIKTETEDEFSDKSQTIDENYYTQDNHKAVENQTKDSSGIHSVIIKEETDIQDMVFEEDKTNSIASSKDSCNNCKVCTDYHHKLSILDTENTKAEYSALVQSFELHKHSHVPLSEKKFKCSECGEKFAWSKEVKRHKLLTHGNYQCDLCHKHFIQMTNLKCHKRIRHKIFEVFNCEFCDEAFFNVKHLARHLKTHTDTKPDRCWRCKKKFDDKKSHECPKKLYQCDVCKKKFVAESNVETHKKKFHSRQALKSIQKDKDKEYKCDVCHKCFKTSRSLLSHKRSHKGNDYKCDTCSKSFNGLCRLKAHQLSHTGVECFHLGNIKY